MIVGSNVVHPMRGASLRDMRSRSDDHSEVLASDRQPLFFVCLACSTSLDLLGYAIGG